MSVVVDVTRIEIKKLVCSPISWLLMAVFAAQAAASFLDRFALASNATAQYGELFGTATNMLFADRLSGLFVTVENYIYFYVPLLTMSVFSRELQSGSISLLLSSPVKLAGIVIGKYLAILLYCCGLAMVLVACVLIAGQYTEHLDYEMAWSGVLAFLLLCSVYTAIGVFVSSLTKHQLIAALGTIAIIVALGVIAEAGGRSVTLIREVAHWLSLGIRTFEIRDGLISSKNIVYFLLVTALFLTFATIKLSEGRSLRGKTGLAFRYGAATILILAVGYLASLPATTLYWDVTRDKTQTLSQASQDIVREIQGPWTVTTYANTLDARGHLALPRAANYLMAQYEPQTRFNPDLTIESVFYYHPSTNVGLYERFPDLTDEELARKFAARWGVDFGKFLSPDEINATIDLRPEKYELTQQVSWKGESAKIRTHDDLMFWPDEQTISAAFLRMLRGPRTVGMVVGHGERVTATKHSEGYRLMTRDVRYRGALAVHGFDFLDVSLRESVPESVDILVLADPRRAFAAEEQEILRQYIESGRNLLVAAEPERGTSLNPILGTLGVQYEAGQVLQRHDTISSTYSQDVVLAQYHDTAAGLGIVDRSRSKNIDLVFAGAGSLTFEQRQDVTVLPILHADPAVSWHSAPEQVPSAQPVNRNESMDRQEPRDLSLAVTRRVGGKEQRIVVVADADFMSDSVVNARGPFRLNRSFVHDVFRWLSGGLYPVNAERPVPLDRTVSASTGDIRKLRTILLFVLPGLIVLSGTIVLLVRRRG